jgi:hypothetical protein
VGLSIDFCGEVHLVEAERDFVIGRDADLAIDENRFIHRRFLVVSQHSGIWVLSNVGSQLAATITDESGQMEAFLAPGGSVPIVFSTTCVSFTAGPTTYEFAIRNDESTFSPPPTLSHVVGETTIGGVLLTLSQRQLIVALSEPRLLGDGRSGAVLPSSTAAADRLGWTITKFNRKLDNVCQKLQQLGVRGLHGDSSTLASNRRSRLVEYAVATRLVTRDDLGLLDLDDADLNDAE